MIICKDCKHCDLKDNPSDSECNAYPHLCPVTGERTRGGMCTVWNGDHDCSKFDPKEDNDGK